MNKTNSSPLFISRRASPFAYMRKAFVLAFFKGVAYFAF